MADNRISVIFGHLCGDEDKLQALGVVNPHTTAKSLYQKHRNKGFQYTLNTSNAKLSPEQRKFYEENGYLMVEKLLPLALVESFRLRFQEIMEGNVPEVRHLHNLQNKEEICEKARIPFFNEVLTEYFTQPQILDYVECFSGQNIVVHHSMSPVCPSIAGSPGATQFRPIQDAPNLPVYPLNRAVCCWTSLEAADRSTGFVVVCPGSHKVGKKLDATQKIFIEMKPGDTLFYHPLLFHDFGSERSTDCRKALSCWFAASECHQRIRNESPSNISPQLVKGRRMNL